MNRKLLITLIILSPFCWLLLLLSISLFLFYLRIALEPGATSPLPYLLSSIIAACLGIVGTVAINTFFIKLGEGKAWIAWVFNIAVTIAYLPVAALTLVLMV
ncbi:MAG: hypothetical protein PHN32_06085 [Actinomycetota bacterium]|jgi:hypothetical protein|nr:hypothetical protein [Actinomycetota bacterium]